LDWLRLADGPVSAGLGRSLFDKPPTLVEQDGFDPMNANIIQDPDLAAALWSDQIKNPRPQ
jgi:hypothetical protein